MHLAFYLSRIYTICGSVATINVREEEIREKNQSDEEEQEKDVFKVEVDSDLDEPELEEVQAVPMPSDDPKPKGPPIAGVGAVAASSAQDFGGPLIADPVPSTPSPAITVAVDKPATQATAAVAVAAEAATTLPDIKIRRLFTKDLVDFPAEAAPKLQGGRPNSIQRPANLEQFKTIATTTLKCDSNSTFYFTPSGSTLLQEMDSLDSITDLKQMVVAVTPEEAKLVGRRVRRLRISDFQNLDLAQETLQAVIPADQQRPTLFIACPPTLALDEFLAVVSRLLGDKFTQCLKADDMGSDLTHINVAPGEVIVVLTQSEYDAILSQ